MSSSTERLNAHGETPFDDFKVGGKPSKRNAPRKKTPLENTYPIDETEQDQIISELFQDAERLAKKGRRSFHYLFLLIAGIYGATFLYSLRYHMEMEHQVLSRWNQFTPSTRGRSERLPWHQSTTSWIYCTCAALRDFLGTPYKSGDSSLST